MMAQIFVKYINFELNQRHARTGYEKFVQALSKLQGGVQVFHGVVHEGALLPTLLCSLQSYNLNITTYWRWPNLHVPCSVTFYIIFCLQSLYRLFITCVF